MLISIAIPAHNRPAFLLEAVRSVADQNYQNFEVVVVDDGSAPPISFAPLEAILGSRIKLQRSERPQGIPKAKNAAIRLARGEIILLLDDDDLLTPGALECVHLAFNNHPDIDCLFLGARPFGPYASGAVKSRHVALTSVLQRAKSVECDGLYFFSSNIFDVLLAAVPIDFQRPAARRGAWNIVGGFDEGSLFSESDWAIRAASICKVALSKNALTEWRIHGNNFGWPAGLDQFEATRRQMDNGINAGGNLLRRFNTSKNLWLIRADAVRRSQSNLLFSKAYYLRDKDKPSGARALWQSFRLSPRPKHVKLMITYIISLLRLGR